MSIGHPVQQRARVPDYDPAFASSILAGLRGATKSIESKWLYDVSGSQLFDAITDLDDYYPTRTEIAILTENARELRPFVFPDTALVELGSGSSIKTRIVLEALSELKYYVPVDISEEHLHAAAAALAADFDNLDVFPVVSDFSRALTLPAALADAPKLVFFPGSTIGNFDVSQATRLLHQVRAMSKVSAFVVGFDLVKSAETLVRAYDDSEGVTAAFNLNLLSRINRELGADFDVDGFRHEARWDAEEGRIEMHLVSKRSQSVDILGEEIVFPAGTSIHTENSHKYSLAGFARIANAAGWRTHATWTDENAYFGVSVLTPA